MRHIPILDLKRQIAPIRFELDAAIRKVINRTSFVFGEDVDEFESDVARYCNARYAIGVSNGTDAIRLSLLALGICPGDTVICPAFTYCATASAVASIGAIPVFADIDPLTYTIAPIEIEKILHKKSSSKIKAVIPVHLYGQCADMDAILGIARRYKIKVVEDAAQSFGAEYKGRKAATLGDCGAVSFFPGKNLGAFGDAGMILTNHKRVAHILKLLRNQGNLKKYFHSVIGYNHRLDTLQAVVLRVKLKYLDGWNALRRENAVYFNKNLTGINVRIPLVPVYNSHIYHQYVLRLPSQRDGLLGHLRKKGIDARVYYPLPLHLQKCFAYLGYKKGDFPESEKASKQTLSLPVFPELTREEKDYIINSTRDFFK